jgi:hypothetical protein
MSEATEEPMICGNCGGTMTDEDAFSISLGGYSILYWHMEHSGCIASLGERLTAATKRAEAAEAERDTLRKVIATMEELAREAYAHWDNDADSKVGKCLVALSGATGLRKDLDRARDAAMEAKV